MKTQTLLLTFLLLFPSLRPAGEAAQDEQTKPAQDDKIGPTGQVQLPLEVYKALLEKSRDPSRLPRPAPVSYALGNARVSVQVAATEPRVSGEIRVDLSIDVLEDDWVLIPVLPAGTPVEAATIGGNPVQLLATPDGLAWSIKKSGSYNMNLSYRVDAMRSDAGFTLAVPLPQAAATQLTASLPGSGLDVALIPWSGVKISQSGQTTRVSATIPTTSGVQISWRTPSRRGHTISRASYSGRLVGNAVDWSGKLSVELFSDETATLSLLPRSVTMSDLKVDGQAAPILVEGDRFVTLVKGRGVHSVVVECQVPVVSGGWSPASESPGSSGSGLTLRSHPSRKERTYRDAGGQHQKPDPRWIHDRHGSCASHRPGVFRLVGGRAGGHQGGGALECVSLSCASCGRRCAQRGGSRCSTRSIAARRM